MKTKNVIASSMLEVVGKIKLNNNNKITIKSFIIESREVVKLKISIIKINRHYKNITFLLQVH